MKEKTTRTKKTFYKMGIGFLIISTTFFILPIVILLIPISAKLKAKTIVGSLILAEITFWLGVLFAGKGIVNKIKNYIKLKKWRKKGGASS